MPGEKVVQRYGDAGDNEWLIRLPQTRRASRGRASSRARAPSSTALTEGQPRQVRGDQHRRSSARVSARDLQRKGIYATLASIVGITIYIALPLPVRFAIGAIVATLHDVLVTLAFLTFFGYDLSLNVVAAILTITGYSVNDTIVIFDRVRENLRHAARAARDGRQPERQSDAGRTIITAGTTFLAVLSLYLFGGEVLEGFAFTMLVGIISGTYSTVFIASAAIAIILSGKRRRRAGRSGRQAGAGGRARRRSGQARAWICSRRRCSASCRDSRSSCRCRARGT